MKKSFSTYVKMTLASAIVFLSCLLCAWRLMQIQITSRETYIASSPNVQTYTQTIESTRGEIVDSDGNPIIENKVGYNVIIEPDTFPEDNKEGNRILLDLSEMLTTAGVTWETSLPINKSDLTFTDDTEAVEKLKSNLDLNVYATAENCIDKLYETYGIDDSYTDDEKYTLATIRYEMLLRDFSLSNKFTLAEDIPLATVTEIKERGVQLRGVDVTENAIRSVSQGDIVPHEIGTVGPIYAEEYDELKEEGYELDDTVGKSGIERAMESTLRGVDGIKTVTVENGEVISSEVTTPVTPGNTVQLTVNSDFQRDLQEILGNFIDGFDNIRDSKTAEEGLGEVSCGAIVVLDCKDGGVLGMATEPTYNLEDYMTNYDAILNEENTPLVNRATDGLYRPGSTFKTITATAGLDEGIVAPGSTYYCGKDYLFKDHTYHCTGSHGDISVTRALQVSCNIYFYHLAENLTIDGITKYAKLFGLGQSTGLETGDATGHLSSQETFESLGVNWTVGQVLQSAIGQGEWAVSPIQMANVACTIANGGTRYQTHLVDSIWDYGHDNCIEEYEPVVAEQIPDNYGYVFETVKEGMIMASVNNIPEKYSLANFGFDVAIKTGTPQAGGGRVQDSFFIGFAPADDPEIAFCGVVEGAEYAKYMIRSVIQAYQQDIKGENVSIDLVDGGGLTTTTSANGENTTTTTTTTKAQ